jgi:hypothetical protein
MNCCIAQICVHIYCMVQLLPLSLITRKCKTIYQSSSSNQNTDYYNHCIGWLWMIKCKYVKTAMPYLKVLFSRDWENPQQGSVETGVSGSRIKPRTFWIQSISAYYSTTSDYGDHVMVIARACLYRSTTIGLLASYWGNYRIIKKN